ncbi:hypothetical protein N7510_009687 [Penicillium lagena]|uniref:uncharacterized protein n=1 Tax=Penicillium lagena TaxID=94218 RepID=UPI002541066B|nr:uncharacterized protein N7510_009687 [Penicillium lagena]KAJ5604533.1 hypothetical protein N7510_009687 [Penicillium lagena]
MPLFHFESPAPPKLDLSSTPEAFQVPNSISATSSLHNSISGRKRPRPDTGTLASHLQPPTELGRSTPLLRDPTQTSTTSTTAADHHSAELDYRQNRYRESFLPPSLDASVDSIEPSSNSRKRSRRDSSVASPSIDGSVPATPVGWGRTVINVVGKVLDLCWSGAFRGFYAGGGRGYDMPAGPGQQLDPSAWQSPSSVENDNIFSSHNQVHLTPVPGQYPEEDIDRNWVVVPTESKDPFIDTGSPSLRARRAYQASSPRRRPAQIPRLNKRAAYSSGARPSTPTRSPTKNPGLTSPRSNNSPGSAEVQRYAAQLRRKERQEDASIRRLNKQLQNMIREGKEALGTTVNVGDLDMEDYD